MGYLRVNIYQKYLLHLGVKYINNIATRFYYNICQLAKTTQ